MGKTLNTTKPKLLVYFSSILQFQGFIAPVIYVFYTRYMGLSTSEYLFCDSLLFLIMAFVEIPSGMIADHFGRKRVLLLSKIAVCFGMVLLLVTKSFVGAVTVSIIYGLFGALESGVAESIIYETFEAADKVQEYEYTQAKANGIGFVISILYAIASGYVIEYSMALPVILDLIVSIALLVIAAILLDDKRKYSMKKHICMPSKKEFRNVIPIVLVASVILACSRTLFSFYQPILTATDIPINFLGYASAMYSIMAALSTTVYKKIRSKLNEDRMLYLIIGIQVIASIGLAAVHSLWVLIFILLQQVQRGIMGPFLYIQVNGQIDSESGNRVTLMSVFYCFTNLLTASSLVLTSFITDQLGVGQSLALYSVIINLLTVVFCTAYIRKRNKAAIR